jgi:hypothetical protein
MLAFRVHDLNGASGSSFFEHKNIGVSLSKQSKGERKMDMDLKPDGKPEEIGLDLLWGVARIAKEIGRNPRQAYHLLESGGLPARKVGGRWCASRTGLRRHFDSLLTGTSV